MPRAFLSKCVFATCKPAQSALLVADTAERIVTLAVANTKPTSNSPGLNLRKLV